MTQPQWLHKFSSWHSSRNTWVRRSLWLVPTAVFLSAAVIFCVQNNDAIVTIATLKIMANDWISTSVSTPKPTEAEDEALDEKMLDQLQILPVSATATSAYSRDKILSDPKNIISPAFHIPDELQSRVGFWFDIYTVYGADERVIHSSLYPWIVFEVVDVAPIINAEVPSLRFLRNQLADHAVKEALKDVRQRLVKLSRKKNLDSLDEDDAKLLDLVKTLPGKPQKNAAMLSHTVRMQVGQKNAFEEGLAISQNFIPEMEKIFAESKLPTELARIPLVESSFNDMATSRVGASGVWQFVGKTGRKFLLMTPGIDERRSPIKSTYAAAKVLKEDYQILKKSWPLAVTAYNHGPGGVRKAAKASHSYELATILKKYHTRNFSFASGNYYTEFLAALYAEKYQDDIFGKVDHGDQVPSEFVQLTHKARASEVLRVVNMSSDEFLELNPDLKQAVAKNLNLPKGFKLHIPTDKRPPDTKLFVSDKAKAKHVAVNERNN